MTLETDCGHETCWKPFGQQLWCWFKNMLKQTSGTLVEFLNNFWRVISLLMRAKGELQMDQTVILTIYLY